MFRKWLYAALLVPLTLAFAASLVADGAFAATPNQLSPVYIEIKPPPFGMPRFGHDLYLVAPERRLVVSSANRHAGERFPVGSWAPGTKIELAIFVHDTGEWRPHTDPRFARIQPLSERAVQISFEDWTDQNFGDVVVVLSSDTIPLVVSDQTIMTSPSSTSLPKALPLVALLILTVVPLQAAMASRRARGLKDRLREEQWLHPPQNQEHPHNIASSVAALGWEATISDEYGMLNAETASVLLNFSREHIGLRVEVHGPALGGEIGMATLQVGRSSIRAFRMATYATIAEFRAGLWLSVGPLNLEIGATIAPGYAAGGEWAIGRRGFAAGFRFGVLEPVIGGYVRAAW